MHAVAVGRRLLSPEDWTCRGSGFSQDLGFRRLGFIIYGPRDWDLSRV